MKFGDNNMILRVTVDKPESFVLIIISTSKEFRL